MKDPRTMLVAVDASTGSEKAVDIAASMVRDVTPHQVVLFHMESGVPPGLIEHRGAEDPGEEAAIDQAAHTRREVWKEKQDGEAYALLDGFAERLTAGGVDPAYIEKTVVRDRPNTSLGELILEVARKKGCGSVVVGRNAYPWYREMFNRHASDDLVRRAEDLAVIVVA